MVEAGVREWQSRQVGLFQCDVSLARDSLCRSVERGLGKIDSSNQGF
jgi:hypothetical protein